MLRQDALQTIYPRLKDQIVVTIMGAVAVELYNLGHRPNFFYLEHGMGLASSMGLGLALSPRGARNQRHLSIELAHLALPSAGRSRHAAEGHSRKAGASLRSA